MSEYLTNIIENKNQICEMQIVFVDIVKYSKRKTAGQVKLINEFTKLIKEAITETNKMHFESLQSNNVSLKSDSILIPTGDGLAIGMPFTWINTLHLDVALNILKQINILNGINIDSNNDKNLKDDSRDLLTVRIGISSGTVILYKDINGKYNIAGNPINMAARVMNCADENQIMFTKEAYRLFDDLSVGSNNFVEYKDKEIKHGLHIDLYQYVDKKIDYLNSNVSQTPADHSDEEIKSSKLSNLVDLVIFENGSFTRQFDGKKISVAQEFAISKNPITQELYERVCKENPSHFKNPKNPVESLTFKQAIEFCNEFSQMEGYEEVYSVSQAGIEYSETAKGFRLPFEIEFDYILSKVLEQAKSISELAPWLNHNSKNQTHAVKDAFIVNDIIGNVWEWCFDNYLTEIKYENFPNLKVIVNNSKTRVVKGGSYTDILSTLENNNFRAKRMEEKRNKNCGFRIVLQNIN